MASASRSSSDTGNVLRRTTATAFCAGVSPRRGNDPLDRFLLRLDLQPVRRVAAVINVVAMPPFVVRPLGRAEPFRQNRRGLVAGLDRRPHLRRGRRSSLCPRTNGGPWLDCEDGSAWPHPVPNGSQNRSCHEKRRSPMVDVIIGDGKDSLTN